MTSTPQPEPALVIRDFDVDPDEASVGDVVQVLLQLDQVPDGVTEVQFYIGATALGARAVVAEDLTVRATRSIPFDLVEGEYVMKVEAAGRLFDLDKEFRVEPDSAGSGMFGTLLMWLVNLVVVVAVIAAIVAVVLWWRGDAPQMGFLLRRSSNRARARVRSLKGFTIRERD